MEKRTIFAIILCIGVLLIWQILFVEPPQPKKASDGGVIGNATGAEHQPHSAKQTPLDNSTKETDQDSPAVIRAPEKLVRLNTEFYESLWTSRGAGLKKFVFKQYKDRVEGKKLEELEPKDLVSTPEGKTLPFSIRFRSDNTDFQFPSATDWSVVEEDNGKVIFRYVDPKNDKNPVITKSYTLSPDPFVIDLEVELSNRSDMSLKEQIILDMVAGYGEQPPAGCMGGGGCAPASAASPRAPACRVNGKVEQLEPKPGMGQEWEPAVLWTGIDEQYFLMAGVAMGVDKAVCKMEARRDGLLVASLMYPQATIVPGDSVVHKFRLFVGPKQLGVLEKVKGGAGQDQGGAKLTESVDFGWLSLLCYPMLWLLKEFNKILDNWGVAIIFLTILIKLLLLPLTQKMMRSQRQMGKLKPMMDELKKRYGDNKQRLNEEMMKLFRANKVNPMSGCFPMLLQMPIWIALYRVLYSAVELYQTPFIPGWINDLSYRDPYYIMPIVLGLAMFLQQKLSPSSVDTQQAKMMMYAMPIFFTFIMLYLPSGLVLYIFVNSILSIGHQLLYNRLTKPPSAASMTVDAKPAG